MERRGGVKCVKALFTLTLISLSMCSLWKGVHANHDYGKALDLSLLFFEAQRSGHLPAQQRVQWRSHSGLTDGQAEGVDLVGGYYDAGDNVKFGFPMAFTVTMLSWSVVEYRNQLAKQGQLQHALDAIRWGTDYFIKAHPEPNLLWAEVGDGDSDHACWQRPEDMSTSRQAYKVSPSNPGTEVAAETAAAMAASSMVFKKSDPAYASKLLTHAEQLFTFADTHRGKYDSSIPIVKQYYPSVSGFDDELLWAAMWLYQATSSSSYLDYVCNNAQALGGTGWAIDQFGWDVKYAGVQTLAAKLLLQQKGGAHASVLQQYQSKAEFFMCAALGRNDGKVINRSPGGMFWTQSWNNMQFVTSAAFLLTVYSDYLTSAKQQLHCPGATFPASDLLSAATSQVDYILGSNNRATSYMVGYGPKFPKEVHHRAASIVSIKQDPTHVTCKGGYSEWYHKPSDNPNILLGAIVGGPDQNDLFVDARDNYAMTEPCSYNNGPIVGVLARLASGPSNGHNGDEDISVTSTTPPSPPSQSQLPNGDINSIKITQHVDLSWTFEGKKFYKFVGDLTNKNIVNLNSLTLNLQGLNGPFWGFGDLEGETVVTLPSWIMPLSPGDSALFEYIQSYPEADANSRPEIDILVDSYSF